MSNGQFDWDDEDQDFRDIPDEVDSRSSPPVVIPSARQIQPPQQTFVAPTYESNEPEYEDPSDSSEDNEDYSVVLSDARLRLEQGRLYEMIMNHSLFDGVDADGRAIKNVQNEIRSFAKERMEIMLGMRLEPSRNVDGLSVALPFNSLEVEVLRSLASTATQGATKSPDVEQYVVPAVESPRRSGLSPIGGGGNTRRSTPPSHRAETRSLPSRSSAPVRRTKVDRNLEARLRSEGVEQEFIEEAKRQIATENYKPLTKHVFEMSEEELKERNRQAVQRSGQQVRSPQALPMATPEQMEALAIQRATAAASHPSMVKIMDLLNKVPKR
jgi:hypothetical protein